MLDDDHFAALLSAPDYLPFRGLEEILALRALLERLERRLVAAARADGCTWQEIGEVLGCTRQTARRRAEEDA